METKPKLSWARWARYAMISPFSILPLLSLKKEITIYDIPDEQIPEMAYLFGILRYLQSRKEIS